MKSFKIFLLLMTTSLIIILSINAYDNYRFEQKVERVNKRVNELKEIGYTEKAAKHIASVENGLIPLDEEYNSLMED
jgi:hypothetical protein